MSIHIRWGRVALWALLVAYLSVNLLGEANRPLPAGHTSNHRTHGDPACKWRPENPSCAKKRQPTLREVVADAVRQFRTRTGGPSVDRMLALIRCESGNDRRARNGSHYGLTQQKKRYWAARSRRAGFAGASIYNVRANVGTAAHVIDRAGGWKQWSCSG